jgi:hypothetical protein
VRRRRMNGTWQTGTARTTGNPQPIGSFGLNQIIN